LGKESNFVVVVVEGDYSPKPGYQYCQKLYYLLYESASHERYDYATRNKNKTIWSKVLQAKAKLFDASVDIDAYAAVQNELKKRM
jgi:hypothetical protein